jgi:hypothetical protein
VAAKRVVGETGGHGGSFRWGGREAMSRGLKPGLWRSGNARTEVPGLSQRQRQIRRF